MMSNPKKTINRDIFLSHLKIILIYVVLTSIVFNLCLRVYVRNQTRSQLVSAAELVKKSINVELFSQNTPSETKNEKELIRNVLKINRVLKQTQSFLDVNYAVADRRSNLIYPSSSDNNEEYKLLNESIMPLISRRKLIQTKTTGSKLINFIADGKKYIAIFYPLKSEGASRAGYLLLYSDLSRTNRLIFTVNLILVLILLITTAIALIISKKVSKKISDPITRLGLYAKNIGDRQYDAKLSEYENDEIGDLAKTMNSMADKLSAYDNAMKTFLQNASHELRTPLMSIQGYAEAVKYDVVDDKDNAVDIIIQESRRLSELVDDLLYLSKIDSMQDDINFERISADDLLKSSIERVKGIAVKNSIVINLHSDGQNRMIYGDEEKLTRAFINLLGNCLRFAEKNIDVTIEDADSKLIIWIRDDGCGFDAKDINNIFDRFYKGKGGNYGLGLAITRSIIVKHNGTISAGNNPEGGAFFKITL